MAKRYKIIDTPVYRYKYYIMSMEKSIKIYMLGCLDYLPKLWGVMGGESKKEWRQARNSRKEYHCMTRKCKKYLMGCA